MTTENDEHNSHAHFLRDPTRILALTDGVFAIIMTILVLELTVPEDLNQIELKGWIMMCMSRLMIYAISFLLAGVYWAGHRMIFSMVKHVNNTLVWLNIIFLMICSLIPFGAAVLGHYPKYPAALFIYGVLLALLAGWRLLMYVYVIQNNTLIHSPVPPLRRKRVLSVMIFAPVMFLISLCFIPLYPTFTLVLYAITPPIFVTAISFANKSSQNDQKMPG